MFSLEPELARLRDEGVLPAATADALIARQRREFVSVYGELRMLTWAGVMLIISGAGIVVSKHLDDIGPMAITAIIALASLACYAYAIWRRRISRASLVDDYILLLGALLASTDVGYVEHVFHQRYLLPLVFFHAITAYFFQSRLVLSVALGTLATWLGLERRFEFLWSETTENAERAFACAGIVFAWRFLDARFRPKTTFSRVFDHFATNVAFFGALCLLGDSGTRLIGVGLAVLFAVASAWFGVRAHEEMFVMYAWIYGTIALDTFVATIFEHEESVILLFFVVSTIGAIVGLFMTHARMRRSE